MMVKGLHLTRKMTKESGCAEFPSGGDGLYFVCCDMCIEQENQWTKGRKLYET